MDTGGRGEKNEEREEKRTRGSWRAREKKRDNVKRKKKSN